MEDHSAVTFIYRGVTPETHNTVSTVKIDPTISSIDDYAFACWFSLTNIIVPTTVTSVGDFSFYNCKSLTAVTLPSTITSLRNHTFDGCSSLTTVTLPSTITSLGHGAFSNCSSLTTITLPSTVTTLGQYIFGGCISLTSVFFGEDPSSSTDALPSTITSVGHGAFSDCTSLTTVSLPSTITSLEDYTFGGCSSLTSVFFEADPRTIAVTTFDGCDRLATIEAPSFSTGNFHKNTEGLLGVLTKAGFSLTDPDQILYSRPLEDGDRNVNAYHNVRKWARTRCLDGRLPLCAAAARSIRWAETGVFFTENMPALHEIDVITGLPLFMLAAVGSDSDLESAYNLLRKYPPAMTLMYRG